MLTSSDISDVVADFAWSQWAGLGGGGWTDGAELPGQIDLEQLIAYSAWVATDHPRVHAVAASWIHQYDDFVARPRLKNLLADSDEKLKSDIADLTSRQAPTRRPARAKHTRTEVALPSLPGRSNLVMLRTRAAIGVGARAEILRLLTHQPDRHRSTAWLARFSAYSKRNVADALTMLERSGLVQRRRVANSDEWSLTDPTTMRKLLGPFPRLAPRMPVQFSVLRALARSAELLQRHPGDAAVMEAVATVESIRADIAALDIPPLDIQHGADLRSTYDGWSRAAIATLVGSE